MLFRKKTGVSLNDEVPSGIICDAMDILYVLEMNLDFYSWYKRGEPFPVNDDTSISAVKRCLSILLSTIKEFTPRNHGNGWRLQKFMKFYICQLIFTCLEVLKTTITHQLSMG